MKKFTLYTLLLFVAIITSHTLHAQFIDVVIGGTSTGYFGDGGPASAAGISGPCDIAFNSGNMYFTDINNHVIRKINTSGVITTVAGNGTSGSSGDGGQATAATLTSPFAIAVNSSGTIYFTDYTTNTIRRITTAGVITKIAGTGSAGYSGDGGPATAAQLNFPGGIAVDGSNNVYFSDANNHVIRKITAGGVISTIAGTGSGGYTGDGGAATAATFNNPTGLHRDASGNLYVADFSNNVIRKITPAGIITTVAGNGSTGFGGDGGAATSAYLTHPEGVITDAAGNLFISDRYNHAIRKVSTSGIITTVTGFGYAAYPNSGDIASAEGIAGPIGLELDGGGNLFIALNGNNAIGKINVGIAIQSSGSTIICSGSTITASSEIFMVNGTPFYQWKKNGVIVGTNTPTITLTGLANGDVITCVLRNTTSGGTILGTSNALTFTVIATPSIAISTTNTVCTGDTVGNINYTASNGNLNNCSINWNAASLSQGFSDTVVGNITTTVAGMAAPGYSGDGGPAIAAKMNRPTGVALDNAGNMYIVDGTNNAIRKVTAAGVISTIAGTTTGGASGDGGPATAANITANSIARDAAGNIYFTDPFDHIIRKINTSGIISKIAGTGADGYAGDGGPATAADLSMPFGIKVDASGNIYFTDFGYHVVRKITTSGIISTIAGSGTSGYSGDGAAATAATFNFPTGLAIDATGNIYIADYFNHVVRKINASGVISTFAGNGGSSYPGGENIPATASSLSNPVGLTIDTAGNVYVVDYGFQFVRKINRNGLITTKAGGYYAHDDGYPATSVGLASPTDVTVDVSGNLYIAEGNRIRKVSIFPATPLQVAVPNSVTPGVYGGTLTVSNGSCTDSTYTFTLTVNPSPHAGTITGLSSVCVSSSITLSDTTTGGTWSRSNTSATVSTTGVVTGVSAGIDTIRYSVTTTCGTDVATKIVVVNPLPNAGAISGPTSVCQSGTITLTNTATGGAWTASNTRAVISASGVVGGLTPGADTITYTVTNGCGTASTSKTITINPLPVAGTISGASSVCVGSNITLTSVGSSASGAWTATNGHATVSSAGIVTGFSAGVDTIVYTVLNSCGTVTTSTIVTVNPAATIPTLTGVTTVCPGATITLTPSVSGGSWSATNSRATVLSSGVVTGITPGTDTIIYTSTGSCGTTSASAIVTVSPTPNAGSISGPTTVCAGSTITLTDAVTGGAWSATNTRAFVSSTGVVSGSSIGIDTIMYTATNSCGTATASYFVTVNPVPFAGTISGAGTVCVSSTITLTSSSAGGSWTATNSRAFISSTGVVSGMAPGADTIIYTASNSCGTVTATAVVTVNPLPNAGTISGATTLCASSTTTYTNTVSGGSWSATNGHATISAAGLVTGISAGVDTIVYTFTNSCGTATTSVVITINPLPNAGAISGASTLCTGSSATLSESVTGGTWSATNSHATISSAGVVLAMTAGVDTIIYTVSNSCGTATASSVMTINPTPNAGSISGASVVCASATITLTNAASGGAWTATNSHATVSSSGLVTGVTAGVDTIVYTVTNSCGTATAIKIITINPLPVVSAITGASAVCLGSSTTLSDTVTGGVWTATNGNAIVSSAGTVFGLATGIDTIIYNVTNSCGTVAANKIVTVNPLPVAGTITGASKVCIGSSITLANTATGGMWTATNANGTLAGTNFTGVIAGIDTIIYRDSNSCGIAIASKIVTVNALPVPVVTASGSTLTTGAGYISYTWYLNGSVVSGALASTYDAVANGLYSVTVTDTNGCTGTSTGVTISLGVNDVNAAAQDIRIFPNPSESVAYIQSSIKVNVTVFAVDGRVALNLQDVKSVDMGNLASGAYMFVIYDNETGAKLKTERIVKMGE